MSTAPRPSNPFPTARPYVRYGITALVAFLLGVNCGQAITMWQLKPLAFLFTVAPAVAEPDT